MSIKNQNPTNPTSKESYEFNVLEEQTISTLSVTWKDAEGNIIVHGEKLVAGKAEEAQVVAKTFAEDLKRNFARRFPPVEPGPPELEGEE